ncbi:MAG: polysaccharide deacetylase [Clostridia bacterium]|nr:polysaccharide deacetylase [Clostridia bacterium]
MKKKNGRRVSVSIIVIFVVLAAIVSVGIFATSSELVSSFTVGNGRAYDSMLPTDYDFIETDGKNGVKYYVITKNSTLTTTAAPASESITEEESATTVAATSKAADTTKATRKTTSRTTAATATTTRKTITTTNRIRNSDEKVAYLTFDDGPSINTEKLLDILDQYEVKATFFVIYHKNMEKKYKAIVNRGHTIALHSYTHSYSKIYRTEKGYYEDLNKIHDYVEKVTGVDSNIIRFPGGSSNTVSRKYNKTIMKTLKQSVTDNGYIFHDWNIDSTDASGINRDPDLLVEKVEAGLKKKKPVVNILMHDTGKSKTTTVEALPRIIEAVQAQGYQIEPLTVDSEVIQHTW